MIRFVTLLSALLLGTACSPKGEQATEWPWTDPDPKDKEETVVTDPNPTIVEKGWTAVSFDGVPEGIRIYKSPSTLQGVQAIAYIAVAEPDKIAWDVWSIDDPETTGTADALMTPSQRWQEGKDPVIVNGGYFFSEGGKNYNASVAVSNGRVYGVNLNYASEDWETYYYPTRGVFYEKAGKMACGWTYYTPSGQHYLYDTPALNSWSTSPLQAPNANFPAKAAQFDATTAIGAGPALVHGGKVVNSWEAELFYGNGSDDKMPEARHPRTAIGCTASRLVLFVCEGRGMTEGVPGLTTGEVAQVMQDLGCVEALNLDGGGSSCMLVGGKSTIQGSDGRERAVGSMIVLKQK